MTPHGHQPRPSKHTIRVGEQRRERERERERERCNCSEVGPGCYWATGPQPLYTRPDPGPRLRPRQLADLSVTDCDHRHRHTDTRILASDTS